MSLVGRVGRKRPRARLALLLIYAILCLGAVTTLYPFLLMASTGFKGPTDQNDNSLIPTYFQKFEGTKDGKPDDTTLYGKYLADKYAGDAAMITSTRTGPTAPDDLIQKYEAFLNQLPVDDWSAGFKVGSSQITSRLVNRYRDWLQKRYPNVDEVNKAYIEEDVGFQTVIPPAELLEKPNWKIPTSRKYQEWREFKATLPAEFRIPVRAARLFQEFLRAKFQNQISQVPPEIVGDAKKFEEIKPPAKLAPDLLKEFMQKGVPDRYRNGAAETKWAEFVGVDANPPKPMTGDVTDPGGALPIPDAVSSEGPNAPEIPGLRLKKAPEINTDGMKVLPWNSRVSQVAVPPMPIEAFERRVAKANESSIRSEFAGRNFAYVITYIALNGRALWNTAIFCVLAILTQLTVNPLAAYALSRYPIRASGQILVFLLATMAFPAEVAMIPGFLLLKSLHLLNTFAALVLPTAASGYMIFLLKGFFDSLPQELFEAGQLDGAKETTMMMRIALPLSRPVLGYLALLAFMGAYGAFLYAFLVVQDQRMWTLMVWIYQLQNTAPKAVVMAALTLAAIPTLLVFLVAQRTIMRGIVLPSER